MNVYSDINLFNLYNTYKLKPIDEKCLLQLSCALKASNPLSNMFDVPECYLILIDFCVFSPIRVYLCLKILIIIIILKIIIIFFIYKSDVCVFLLVGQKKNSYWYFILIRI